MAYKTRTQPGVIDGPPASGIPNHSSIATDCVRVLLFKGAEMKGKRLAIENQKFGRLTAIKACEAIPGERTRWIFRCECGVEKAIIATNVVSGHTLSCGCYKSEYSEKWKKSSVTHGLCKSKEYRAWAALINRCENPKNADYPKYGGRGISVCTRWRHDFMNFYADMGPRPSANHSIDRIDVNGNYEPSNCRWATKSEQQKNKRPKKI